PATANCPDGPQDQPANTVQINNDKSGKLSILPRPRATCKSWRPIIWCAAGQVLRPRGKAGRPRCVPEICGRAQAARAGRARRAGPGQRHLPQLAPGWGGTVDQAQPAKLV